jgi:D-glycero-D-manno-heptose 1,7-bisphosphate phosphatase
MSSPAVAARRAAFLDRDGVINVDHGYTHRIEDFDFVPGVLEAAAQLVHLGLQLVVVTNQAGIGRGLYGEADFARLTHWMKERFVQAGAPIAAVYHCPHHPTLALGDLRRACECRKPAPGMLLQAQRELRLDMAGSVFFGDKCDDMRAGLAAGVGLRVLLGKDGLELPVDTCADGQVTQRHRSLATALADPLLRERLGAVH